MDAHRKRGLRMESCHIELMKAGSANCFLIHRNGEAVLIDTGKTAYRDRILEACRNFDMRAIALTHGHYDHVQNAAFLSNELNVPIVMSEKDLPLIQSNCAEAMQADTAIGRAVLSVSQRGFENETIEDFRPAKFLEEGTTLVDFGFPDIYVIELPGHTKGSIGFVTQGQSGHPALFVGDALMNLVYPSSAMFYGNGEDARASAQRISSFGEATIHFGHGRSLPNKESW